MGRNSAKKVFFDNITFDSKEEHLYYLQLKDLESQGLVSEIEVHKPFELIPKYETRKGDKIRAMNYVADFVYLDIKENRYRVVDIKGFEEEHFKLKKKIFEWFYCEKNTTNDLYYDFDSLEVLKYTKKTGFIPIKEYKKSIKNNKKLV